MKTKPFKHIIKYPWECEGTEHTLVLSKEEYDNNGTLAIVVLEINSAGEEEYFDTITTNIPWGSADESHAYIDTNNCSWAEKMLKQHRFAKDTYNVIGSGYCKYPLYEFNLSKFTEQ